MENCSKRIISMPVYSIQEGNHLGTVKSLLIDNGEKAVAGLIVERRRFNREERFIPYSHIQSVGEDVITIDKASVVDRRKVMPQTMRQMRNPFMLIGAKVFTVGGKILGKVEEYRFNTQDGKISALEIGGGGFFKDSFSVDAKYITTMASGTIMIEDAALDDYETVNNSLHSAMDTVMEKANNVFTGTMNVSKKLGQNISQTFQKFRQDEDDEEPAQDPSQAPQGGYPDQTVPEEAPSVSPYAGMTKEDLEDMSNVVIAERPSEVATGEFEEESQIVDEEIISDLESDSLLDSLNEETEEVGGDEISEEAIWEVQAVEADVPNPEPEPVLEEIPDDSRNKDA